MLRAMFMFAATVLIVAGVAQSAVTNRYDFEPSTGFVTEPGWTHMQSTTIATSTTPGWISGESVFMFPNLDRGSSTQAPTLVTRDLVIGNGAGNGNGDFNDDPVTLAFRDIVPGHWMNSVAYTIYRTDPIDSFLPRFKTTLSHNGGPQTTLHTGTFTAGTIHPPITGTFAFATGVPATPSTLDFRFFAYFTGSENRLNGIELVYTPEPSGALLLVGAAVCIARRRTR